MQPGFDASGFIDGALDAIFLEGELIYVKVADKVAQRIIYIQVGDHTGKLSEIRLRQHSAQTALRGSGCAGECQKKTGKEEEENDPVR